MRVIVPHLFAPHYTNNHRAVLLQPAGLVMLTALYLISQFSLQLLKYAPALPGGVVLGYASSISADQVVQMTNTERAKLGLGALSTNAALNQAATAKAAHMFQNDYWAHIAPDGTSPWTFIKNAGYRYTIAGENLARDFEDSGSMMTAWMNSPTHRENIVNAKFSQIGVAVVNGTLGGVETTLVVQMFGAPPQVAAAPPQTSDTGIATKQAPQNAPEVIKVEEPVPVEAEQPAIEVEAPEETVYAPIPQDALGTTLGQAQQSGIARALISPLDISKAIGTSIILILIGMLLYDTVILHKRNLPRRVGKNWAHLALFSVVLMVIIAMREGTIL